MLIPLNGIKYISGPAAAAAGNTSAKNKTAAIHGHPVAPYTCIVMVTASSSPQLPLLSNYCHPDLQTGNYWVSHEGHF